MIDEKKDESIVSRLRSRVKTEKKDSPDEEQEAPRKTKKRGMC